MPKASKPRKTNPTSAKKKTVHKRRPKQSVTTYKNLHKSAKSSKNTRKTHAKAKYLATLPKSRFKRLLYRLNPSRIFKFWFSKDGLKMAAKLSVIGLLITAVVGASGYMLIRRDLPNPREISNRSVNQTTKFYDRTGDHLLFELYGDVNRTLVEFDEISNNMKWATVAIEDKDFYDHGGYSVRGTLRAFVNNIFGDNGTQGGSTITQQFIKNSLLSSEQTVTRKVKELILATELERLYSKDEILSFYLNEIPFGSLEYGIEAAAQSFFAKSASELTVAESALLAALPQAPSYFSPYGDHTDELLNRQRTIINLMAAQGYITQEQAQLEKEVDILANIVPAEARSIYTNIKAPHFVLEVQKQLEEEYGANFVRNSGLRVITTLDYELQEIAEKAVNDNIATVVNAPGGGGGDNAALVSTDVETGQVTAMVGSRDFKYPGYGSYNAAMALRQPGSSIKPFGYAELFSPGAGANDNRWGPDSYIYDVKTTFGDYTPKNYEGGFKGRMKVRNALGMSRNIPAVKAAYMAGVDNILNLAIAMGNESLAGAKDYGLSFILGASEVRLAEHAHAYAAFARSGIDRNQAYILKVENSDGEILKEWKDEKGAEVLNPQVAYLISDMLSDDSARAGVFGFNNPLFVIPGVTNAVKTGTTNSDRDGWMMGFSRYMSLGVWVGNHDNKPMGSATSRQTGPIFTQFMRDSHKLKNLPQVPIYDQRPAGIKDVAMDSQTGYAATENSTEKFIGKFPSWYKPEYAQQSEAYNIDVVSGKKPTECTPARAIEERVGSGSWPELPYSDRWYGIWAASAGYASGGTSEPTESDDVHSCSDKKPNVSISAMKQSDSIYKLVADTTQGTHALKQLVFKVDGQIVNVTDVNSSGKYSYTHAFASSGDRKVTAEIIDQALYDNSASKTVKVTGTFNSGTLSVTKPSKNGQVDAANVEFSWSNIQQADSYQICWEKTSSGSPTCIKTQSTSYSPSTGLEPSSNYIVYAQAYLGSTLLQTSAPNNFSTN